MTQKPPVKRPPSIRGAAFSAMSIQGIDIALLPAAGRIIEGSLSVVSGERVAILTSKALTNLGAAIRLACETLGAEQRTIVLENEGARPHKELCQAAARALEWAQASVLCADSLPDERLMRMAVLSAVTKHNLRHAHMIGVTTKSVLAGFSVDAQRVAATAKAVRVRVRPSSVFRVKSHAGTDLTVRCDPACRWSEHSGLIRAGRLENLPAAELVTCPADVSGVYVATASMLSSFGIQRDSLRGRPLKLWFEGGVVRRMESQEDGLAQDLTRRLRVVPNSARAGLVVLGTNVGMYEATGDVLTDKTIPGVHIWLGRTLPDETGARWSSDAWVGLTSDACDVDLDDVPLIRQGRYIVF